MQRLCTNGYGNLQVDDYTLKTCKPESDTSTCGRGERYRTTGYMALPACLHRSFLHGR